MTITLQPGQVFIEAKVNKNDLPKTAVYTFVMKRKVDGKWRNHSLHFMGDNDKAYNAHMFSEFLGLKPSGLSGRFFRNGVSHPDNLKPKKVKEVRPKKTKLKHTIAKDAENYKCRVGEVILHRGRMV